MPVRITTVAHLAERIRGIHWFKHGVSETITREQLDFTLDAADALYENVVWEVDWARILIEASAIHLALAGTTGHNDSYSFSDGVCGSCLRTALLSVDQAHRYETAPIIPESKTLDWALAIAEAVTFRQKK